MLRFRRMKTLQKFSFVHTAFQSTVLDGRRQVTADQTSFFRPSSATLLELLPSTKYASGI